MSPAPKTSSAPPLLRLQWSAGVLLLLWGCGSGGGAAPPPEPLRTTPHVLQATQPEADALAAKVANSALTGLRIHRDLESLDDIGRLTRELVPRLFDDDEAAGGTRAEVDCTRNPFRLAPLLCSGSLRIDVNQREVGDTIAAGTFFDLQFDRFQLFTPAFERLRISGGLRIGYVTTFDTRAQRGILTYESAGLSTNQGGTILDASEGTLTVTYGDGGIVVDSAIERFIDLQASASGDEDGNFSGGVILSNFGDGFVDIRPAGWIVAGAAPQAGSVAAVGGGAGSSATITVSAVTPGASLCQVVIRRPGESHAFAVQIALR